MMVVVGGGGGELRGGLLFLTPLWLRSRTQYHRTILSSTSRPALELAQIPPGALFLVSSSHGRLQVQLNHSLSCWLACSKCFLQSSTPFQKVVTENHTMVYNCNHLFKGLQNSMMKLISNWLVNKVDQRKTLSVLLQFYSADQLVTMKSNKNLYFLLNYSLVMSHSILTDMLSLKQSSFFPPTLSYSMLGLKCTKGSHAELQPFLLLTNETMGTAEAELVKTELPRNSG